MEEPYYRIYAPYDGERPAFDAPAAVSGLDELLQRWTVVRDEFEAFRAGRAAPLRPSYVPDDVAIHGWRSVNLITYLHRYRDHCRAFPRTMALLDAIPNVTSAFINVLEPGAELPPHHGDTNTTYRCHIGLSIPGGVDVCGLSVAGERRGWAEGHVLVFSDAQEHFVWNRTDRERVILLVDVMREEYIGRKLEICGMVLGAITLRAIDTKWPVLAKLPLWMRRAAHVALGRAATLVLRVERWRDCGRTTSKRRHRRGESSR